MIKNKVVAFILFMVLFLVCWNMLDLLYCAVITVCLSSLPPSSAGCSFSENEHGAV